MLLLELGMGVALMGAQLLVAGEGLVAVAAQERLGVTLMDAADVSLQVGQLVYLLAALVAGQAGSLLLVLRQGLLLPKVLSPCCSCSGSAGLSTFPSTALSASFSCSSFKAAI